MATKRNTQDRIRLLGAEAAGQDDESREIFRQFIHNTTAFGTRMQAIRKALGRAIGLTATQYTILVAIARRERKGGVGLNAIAERLHFTPAFATIEVNKLVAAGLVTKRENPEDRRRVLLAITPKARDLLRSLRTIQEPANAILAEGLSPEDVDVLRGKMLQLVNNTSRALQLIEFLTGDAPAAVGDDPY
jgi:MarR family transcriptional regulator, organic hydroperoxide resistance regulator